MSETANEKGKKPTDAADAQNQDQASKPLLDPQREELAQLVGRIVARAWVRQNVAKEKK